MIQQCPCDDGQCIDVMWREGDTGETGEGGEFCVGTVQSGGDDGSECEEGDGCAEKCTDAGAHQERHLDAMNMDVVNHAI